MKKLIFVLLSLFLFVKAQAQSSDPTTIVDMQTYNAVPGSTFVYNHTFSGYNDIYFTLPFGYDIEVEGNHIEFKIDYEDFMWFLMRHNDHPEYVDFFIYEKYSTQSWEGSNVPSWDFLYNGGIIRIFVIQ